MNPGPASIARIQFSVVIVPQRAAGARWHQMRGSATSIIKQARCVGLLQWMGESECIDLHAGFKDFPHGWIGRKVATVQHLRAREMRYQTRYRQWWAHRRSKTVLFADHLRACFRLCGSQNFQPMPHPVHPCFIVKAEFLLEIFACSRHHIRMRIDRHYLRKCTHMRTRMCVRR